MISLSSALALDITALLLCTLALFRFARLSATHPGASYLVFHFLIVTLRLLAVSNGAPTLFSVWSGPASPVTPDEMARAGLLADLGLAAMSLGWIIAYQRSSPDTNRGSTPAGHPLRISLIRAVAFVTIPIGVVALLFFAQLPGGMKMEADLGEWNSSSYVTMMQSWAGLGLMALIYWYGFKPLMMGGVAIYLAVMAYQGHDRFRVVIVIILLVQIYLDRRGLRWPTGKMLAFLVLAGFLFFPLKQIGYTLQQGQGLSEVGHTISSSFREVSSGEHGDQMILDMFAATLTGSDVNGKLFLGQTYAGLLTVPIPRQWWPEKPGLAEQMAAISDPTRPMGKSGMVTMMLGEFYLNFSYAGIAVMSFLFALCSGKWFNAAYRNGYFSVEHFLYLLLACNLLQVYRDGLISLFVFTVINMLPLTLMGALHFFPPLRLLIPVREAAIHDKAVVETVKAAARSRTEAYARAARFAALQAEVRAEAVKAGARAKTEAHVRMAGEAAGQVKVESPTAKIAAQPKAEAEARKARYEAARARAEAAAARFAALAQAEIDARKAWEAAAQAKAEAEAAKIAAQAQADSEAAKIAARVREEGEALKARDVVAQAKVEAEVAEIAARAQADAETRTALDTAAREEAEAGAAREEEASRPRIAVASVAVVPAAAAVFAAASVPVTADAANSSAGASMYKFLDLEAARIRYRRAGSGHQLLLLHEWGSSMDSMNVVFDALASTYAVVAMDFPGHGQSGEPPHALALKDFSDCVLSVMDHLHLTDPHILAHSFGGSVAAQLAHDHPERVSKLVLENTDMGVTAKSGSSAGAEAPLKSRFSRLFKSGPEAPAARASNEALEKVWTANLVSILPSVKSETLLIYGENDAAAAQADQMRGLIPLSEVVSLKNAGHASHREQSAMFLLVTKRFLRDGTLGPPPPPRR